MNFRKYRPYQLGEFIVAFADTAAGGIDYCAVQFLSKTNLDIPTVYHSQEIASIMTPNIHLELEKIYDQTKVKPVIAYETNNGAIFELERLSRLNRNQKYTIYQQKIGVGTVEGAEESSKLGWYTNSANRTAMLSMLKEAIDQQLITIYDKPTVSEMFSFIVNQTNSSWKAQAEQGAHDDLIMSLAGAWQLYQSENPITTPKRTRQPRPRSRLHL